MRHRFLAFHRPRRAGRRRFLESFTALTGKLDGRTKRGGLQCNFYIHYEVDDDEVPTVLQLAEYGGEDEGCWVLLESVGCWVLLESVTDRRVKTTSGMFKPHWDGALTRALKSDGPLRIFGRRGTMA